MIISEYNAFGGYNVRAKLKPGPKPRGKTATILARVSPETRKLLDAARLKSGNSLSREIEDRLAGSFVKQEALVEDFGDLPTYAFCRLIAIALKDLRRECGEPWHKNAWIFEHARGSVRQILSYFQPSGPGHFPDDFPALRGMNDITPARRKKWKRQFEKAEFGMMAAQRAVFMLEASATAEDATSPYVEQFKALSAILRSRLLSAGNAGKALADLAKHPDFDW
jgi:hypothetical protein